MLHIKDDDFIGRGVVRSVYQHPENEKVCIKVLNQYTFKTRRNLRSWVQYKLRNFININQRILENYNKTRDYIGEYLPQFYDNLVETNMGNGLIVELIKDGNGSVSPTLREYLKKNSLITSDMRLQFDKFFELLVKHNIFLFDINNFNNFVVRTDKEFNCKIFYIDIKSLNKTKSFIPLDVWFKSFARAKLKRRIKRVNEKINKRKI